MFVHATLISSFFALLLRPAGLTRRKLFTKLMVYLCLGGIALAFLLSLAPGRSL
jgi:hypothetical protein